MLISAVDTEGRKKIDPLSPSLKCGSGLNLGNLWISCYMARNN